jgi:rhodanese-related sulfurtransferase
MKTIYKNEYHNDGVLINLDTSFVPYENLLNNHYKYLDKNKKYYFYCKKGIKARKVASILEAYGYDVTMVKNKD